MDFLKDFGVQPILLAAQVVNFLILLFILKKLLYGPLLKVLAERREKIEASLKQAAEIEARLTQTEEDRDKVLAKASQEAQKIVNEARFSAQQIIDGAHQKAAQDMEGIVKKGQEEIVIERDRMQQELRADLADLVVRSLEKVTGKLLNKKDQKDLIDRSIKGLS